MDRTSRYARETESLHQYLAKISLTFPERKEERDIEPPNVDEQIERALDTLEPSDRVWIELLFGLSGNYSLCTELDSDDNAFEDERTKRILRELRSPTKRRVNHHN